MPTTGDRRIVPDEAAIVRRIFEAFAAGRSPRAIAMELNADGIPGPAGRAWGPSTIYGNWRRGTGILNNELYVGRLVWNRQRFVKNPATGRRQARPNPPEAWVTEEVPDLRIVDNALWERVKARQSERRESVTSDGARPRPERARRPRYLFSGLLRCGACGSGFVLVGKHHYGCAAARNQGTCTNRLTSHADERDLVPVEDLDERREVGERAAEPVDLVDDDHVDEPLLDVGEKALQPGPLQRSAGDAAVVIGGAHQHPAFGLLAGDVGLAGLALGVEAVELLLQPSSLDLRV